MLNLLELHKVTGSIFATLHFTVHNSGVMTRRVYVMNLHHDVKVQDVAYLGLTSVTYAESVRVGYKIWST